LWLYYKYIKSFCYFGSFCVLQNKQIIVEGLNWGRDNWSTLTFSNVMILLAIEEIFWKRTFARP